MGGYTFASLPVTWKPFSFMATAAELAGASLPPGLDSLSFAPALLGRNRQQQKHEWLYFEFHEGGFTQAARWRDWKAVRNHLDEPTELYDLARDPGEKNNLASAHPEIVAQMESFMKSARTENADWPVRKGQRKPAAKAEAPL